MLHADPEYKRALVAGPCRELLWAVAREPTLTASEFKELTDFAKSIGKRVAQRLWAQP